MATKRRYKHRGEEEGEGRAAATSSHHSSLDPNRHANCGRSLKNRPDFLGFRSCRQDTPSWKKTFSLGALLSDVMSGKCINMAFGAPNDAIIVICSWQLQIWGRFFLFLKFCSARSGTFSVKGTCLSLEALPYSMPEKRRVPAPAGVQVQTALSVRASPRSRK